MESKRVQASLTIGLATAAYYFLALPVLILLLVFTDGEPILSSLLGVHIDPEATMVSIALVTLLAPLANLVGVALAATVFGGRAAKAALGLNGGMLLLMVLVLVGDRLG